MAVVSSYAYAILLKSKVAEEKDRSSILIKKRIDKGELVVVKDRIPRQRVEEPLEEPSHNYSLYRDSTVTLYDDGTGICPLEEAAFQCLAAVSDCNVRFAQYTTGKIEWVTNLQVGDMVFFQLATDPNAKAHPIIKGKIRYFGIIEGREGFMFGNEIVDSNYRGKGTTDGSPHFNCGYKNAVYMAMDKITKKVNGESNLTNILSKGSSRDYFIDEAITTKRKSQRLVLIERPAGNTHNRGKGSSGDGRTLLDKAKHRIAAGLANVTPTRIPSDIPSKFSFGDRVVLQSAKGFIVKGTVRWTERMRMSRETSGIVIPVVGIETNRPVNEEEEFPGLCYSVTGSHGQHLFTVAHNHGRIFVPEQIVLTEDEYQSIHVKRKEKSKEVQEMGLSVEEYRQQRERLLSERNREKDIVEDQRKRDPTTMEEEITTVGGWPRTGGRGLEETVQVGPDGGDPVMSETYIKKQIQVLRRFNKQKSKDDEFEVVHKSDCPSLNNDQPGWNHSLFQSYTGNPEQTIVYQEDNHDSQHNKTHRQTNPQDRPHPHKHANYRQYSDDMNDALKPVHPGYDDHHSPSLQYYYKPHLPPQCSYSTSSTGHTPPMGDVGGKPYYSSIPSDPSDFTVGTRVNVQMHRGPPRHGVIQWIGTLPNFDRLFAGVELDEYLDKCSDGTYNGRRYFTCPYGRGLFCLMSALQLDERYMESHQLPPANRSQHNSKTVLGLASPTVDESDRLKQEVRQLKEALERKEEEFVVTIEKLRNAHQEEEKRYQTTKRELDQHRREMERILEAHKSDEFKQSWQISNKNIRITAQELGKGGWGVVVVGVFREQKVAVKQLYDVIKSEHNLVIMNREINTMSRLRHPNLLLFIGAVLDHPSGNPLIITEIMDTSLRHAYEKGQLTNDETSKLSILRDTASGLNYLHCHHDEIIHRDVSSANVLLELRRGLKNWRAKLSDFGSANIARQAYTQQMGAAVYSAPEAMVAIGDQEQQQTTKMDVYSYGILSCEVMCCQFPGSHAVFRTMLSRVHTSSPSIGQMIQNCMNKSPQQRPTMVHVIHCLDDLLQ